MRLRNSVFSLRVVAWRFFLALIVAVFVSPSALAGTEDILREVRNAAGGAAWDEISILSYRAKETSSGMCGQARSVEDLKSGKIRRDSDFRIVRFLDVWDEANHWRQNMTGGVHAINSTFGQEVNGTDRWLARRGWLRPGAGGAKLGVVERRNDAGTKYDVVTFTPINGQPIEFWFDATTHFPARTVRVMPITIETTYFSDYRTVSGVKLPFRIETKDRLGECRPSRDFRLPGERRHSEECIRQAGHS